MSFNNGKIKFQIDCASRGYHIYRNIWSPKLGQDLLVKEEVGNVHDPFAMSIGADIPGKLTSFDIVGHIPREISRFCHYFVNYGGAKAKVRETKYRKSPIPSGGLEIPILLIIKKGESSSEVFEKMEIKVKEMYIEPDKINSTNNDDGIVEDDEDDDGYEIDWFIDKVDGAEPEEDKEANIIGETQIIKETQNDKNTKVIVIDGD